ncbi:G protein-coupled receptor, partial [Reticulomyxa filosa]
SLESIVDLKSESDWTDQFVVEKSTFPDISTAKWAQQTCFRGNAHVTNSLKSLVIECLVGVVCLILLFQIFAILSVHNSVVMKECAWKLCILYIVGGMCIVGSLFVELATSLSSCYAKLFLRHCGFVLSLGILFGKTWRLWSVFNSALHLKNFRMTVRKNNTKEYVCVCVCVCGDYQICILVWGCFGVYLGIRPYSFRTVVYDRYIYKTCYSESFPYVESVIYVCYGLAFLYIGRLAFNLRRVTKEWHLRSKGTIPKYNDNKWVVIISYNVLLMVTLLIIANHLSFADPSNHFLFVSVVQIVIIIMNTSLYIVPKLIANSSNKDESSRKRDVEFSATSSLQPWRYLIIDRQNKDNLDQDVDLIREYLEPFGFKVTFDNAGNMHIYLFRLFLLSLFFFFHYFIIIVIVCLFVYANLKKLDFKFPNFTHLLLLDKTLYCFFSFCHSFFQYLLLVSTRAHEMFDAQQQLKLNKKKQLIYLEIVFKNTNQQPLHKDDYLILLKNQTNFVFMLHLDLNAKKKTLKFGVKKLKKEEQGVAKIIFVLVLFELIKRRKEQQENVIMTYMLNIMLLKKIYYNFSI